MSYERNTALKIHREPSKGTLVNLNGIELFVQQEGEGKPIVFLQGLSCTYDIWDRWAERLKSHYKLIRFDLPKTGKARESDNGLQIVHYIEIIDQLVQQLGLEKFYLAGSSFGGQLACEYTFQHENKVEKLILAAPSGFTLHPDQSIISTLKSSQFEENKEQPTKPVSVVQLPAFYHNERVSKNLEKVRKIVGAFSARKKVQASHKFDNLKHITELNQPTLMIWGENDKIVPVSDANKFRTFMTNVRLLVYPNAGHFVFDEYIGKTFNDLKAFLG